MDTAVINASASNLPPCPVGADSLLGIKRQQTNPARWEAQSWQEFAAAVRQREALSPPMPGVLFTGRRTGP